MSDYTWHKLEGHNVVPCPYNESPHDDWLTRCIGRTYVGKYWVSTEFLCANLKEGMDAPPEFFETTAFAPPEDGLDLFQRYATYQDAVNGHLAWVLKLAKEQGLGSGE